MDKNLQIKGIKESEYPTLYAALVKNMVAYNITKIKVRILPRGLNAAAFSFFGDNLMVTKKLLETMNEEEIEAVVAHEFSHIFNRDSIARLSILLIFSIPLILFSNYSAKANLNSISPGQGILILIFLIISMFSLSYGIKIMNWMSVLQEIRSDREAVLRTKNPEAMMNALLKIYIEPFTRNKRQGHVEKILESFEYLFLYFFGFTHPVSKERLEYLELAKKMVRTQKVLSNFATTKK